MSGTMSWHGSERIQTSQTSLPQLPLNKLRVSSKHSLPSSACSRGVCPNQDNSLTNASEVNTLPDIRERPSVGCTSIARHVSAYREVSTPKRTKKKPWVFPKAPNTFTGPSKDKLYSSKTDSAFSPNAQFENTSNEIIKKNKTQSQFNYKAHEK